MVWVVEKKVFHHILDLGFESVGIPVRVKFEFEIRDGLFVAESLATERLYNQRELARRYPNLKLDILERDIEKMIHCEILKYLKENGYLKEASG